MDGTQDVPPQKGGRKSSSSNCQNKPQQPQPPPPSPTIHSKTPEQTEPDLMMKTPPTITKIAQAKENSIEVYDEKFGRNLILTRSARIRKFKFYQYKPVYDSPSSPNATPIDSSTPVKSTGGLRLIQQATTSMNSPVIPESPVLLPRDEILQGKVPLVTAAQQSKELIDVDNQILELEKKIAELNSNINNNNNNNDASHNSNLDEIFDLVNKKNDLLRRQMQLNILEQEKILEKANEELTKELRSMLSIEDSKKSKAMLERQQYLYDQSLALVNRRNELVLHMDVQEKGIEEDMALKEQLKSAMASTTKRGILNRSNSSGSSDQSCCIQ